MVVMIAMVVVVIAVILVVPVTLMDPPALGIVVVVRMTPVRACIRRSLPEARDPDIMSSPDCPVAVDPHIAIPWHRRTYFITDRWRGGTDDDRNLPEHRNRRRNK